MAIGIGLKLLGAAGAATVALELNTLKNLIKEEDKKGNLLSPKQKTEIKEKIKTLTKKLPDLKGKPFDQQAGKKAKKPEGKAEKRFNKGGLVKKKRKKK
tara:strand:- start:120 stop:416 length:297 start_codon:yes stop_codon:yes gene_type:complete